MDGVLTLRPLSRLCRDDRVLRVKTPLVVLSIGILLAAFDMRQL